MSARRRARRGDKTPLAVASIPTGHSTSTLAEYTRRVHSASILDEYTIPRAIMVDLSSVKHITLAEDITDEHHG